MTAPKVPRLTVGTIRMDGAVGDAIDALLINDPEIAKYRRKILQRQQALHEAVEEAAWQRFLAVEEAVNERHHFELVQVAVWAFKEGRTGW